MTNTTKNSANSAKNSTNTINNMLSTVNRSKLTDVGNARLNELINSVPSTDTDSIKLFNTYVKSMAMGKTAKVVKAMMISAVQKHLSLTKSMSFEKFCSIVGEDKSNASKLGKVADIFYYFSDKFNVDVTEFTTNQLTPFAGKDSLEIQNVFNKYNVSPLNSVVNMREISKLIKTIQQGKNAVLATDYTTLDKCMVNGIYTPIEDSNKDSEQSNESGDITTNENNGKLPDESTRTTHITTNDFIILDDVDGKKFKLEYLVTFNKYVLVEVER